MSNRILVFGCRELVFDVWAFKSFLIRLQIGYVCDLKQ